MEDVSALRVSLSLDTASFADSIKGINQKLRAIKSEFSAASDGTKSWANSLEGMQAKTENLTRQLEVHRQKVASLKQQYEDVATAQGADSRAAENLLVQYNNAVGVMRRVETSLETVNRRVQEQTSEFGQLQRRVNTSVESMDRELRVLESSFEQVATSIGHAHGAGHQMAQTEEELNRRHDQLNQSIDIQRRRLGELRTLLEATTTAEGVNSRAAQEMQIRYNQASQALNRTQHEMHAVHAQVQAQSSAWGRLGQALGGSMTQLGMVGMNLQMTGMNIAMSFGVAAAAVGGAIGMAVKKSIDFGAEMSKTGAIAGATGKDLEALRQSALKLGSQTSLTATQVAEAQTEMAKKGFQTNQIIAAMPGIISAAEASGEDLAMVADTVTSAISSFGLAAEKSSHVADVLARAANDSAAGVEDMQFAFKYAAAPAHALGISIEELSAATEIMANAGIKGETAGTSLRAAMLRLVKPPKQAKVALADLGVSIKDSHGKMLPLSNIIGQLNDKTKGMANAQKTAALAAIFGTEAVSGMLALVNAGAPQIDKFTKSLKESDGASAEAAKKMKNNLKGALLSLQGAFESAQITIGNSLAPAITKVAAGLKSITNAFNNLSPGMQKFIAIGGAVTAILLAIVTALGFITMAIGGTIMAWSTLTAAMAPLGAVMISSILPIMGIIAGLVGLGALLYKGWKTNFGGLRDFTSQVWTLIVQKFNEVKTYIMPLITQLVAYISQQWKTIGPMVTQVMNVIGQVIKFILPLIFSTIKFYLDAIINVFKGAFNIIAGVIKFFVALFSGDWSGMWAAIKQVLTGAVQAIWGLFNLWFVGKIAGVIGGFVNKGIGFIAKFAGDGLRWIGSFVGQGFSKIASFGSNIVSSIGRAMAEFGDVIVKWLANAIKSYIDFSLNVVKTLGSIVGKVGDIGVNIVKGIWSGIESMGSWIVKKLSKWALAVIPGPIAKALGIKSPSRLLADKVGKWLPAGIAMGVENNMTPLNKAVSMMSLASVPTSIPSFGSTSRINQVTAYPISNNRSLNVTVNAGKVDMDEYQLTRTLQRMEALYG